MHRLTPPSLVYINQQIFVNSSQKRLFKPTNRLFAGTIGDGSGTIRTVPNRLRTVPSRSKRPTFHNDRKKAMCYTVDSLDTVFLKTPLERRIGT